MFSGNDRILTVKIDGELDHHTSDLIRRKIDREMSVKNYIDIIFDFSGLSFMDSSGVGLIMGRYKHTEKLGGRVAIASAGADIRRIIEISGLHKICSCFEDEKSAAKALKTANRRGQHGLEQ